MTRLKGLGSSNLKARKIGVKIKVNHKPMLIKEL